MDDDVEGPGYEPSIEDTVEAESLREERTETKTNSNGLKDVFVKLGSIEYNRHNELLGRLGMPEYMVRSRYIFRKD